MEIILTSMILFSFQEEISVYNYWYLFATNAWQHFNSVLLKKVYLSMLYLILLLFVLLNLMKMRIRIQWQNPVVSIPHRRLSPCIELINLVPHPIQKPMKSMATVPEFYYLSKVKLLKLSFFYFLSFFKSKIMVKFIFYF